MTDISIIVSTLNRSPLLVEMLNSITRTVDPSDAVEIMIIDNGSVDETSVVAREITRKFPRYEWRYIYEPMPGLLSGRHRGAKE
jgi:glycosyltransferase involved in cell wall biosynthesis